MAIHRADAKVLPQSHAEEIDRSLRAPITGNMQVIYRLADLDGRILDWVALRRGRLLTTLMRAVTRTGDAPSVVAALALALALRPGRPAALVTASTLV